MIQTLISRTRSALQQEQTPDGGPSPREEENDRVSTALFHCRRCASVYICETMESCPECSGSVESVPTEEDLGFI